MARTPDPRVPARPDLSGAKIGQYRVLQRIGGGGMGLVYKAEDSKLGRTVALKFLPHASAEPSAVERFQREARAASALNHPNICTIYDIEDYGDEQFIAMEYIEGRTLAELIGGRPPELEIITKIGMQIAEGLAAAHAKGIVHCDIKPGNTIVASSGLVKILDFGLAKLFQGEEHTVATASLTQSGAVSGTLPYMSPEQLRGRDVDHRSDIFALGAVLYEMATGRRPFDAEVTAELIDQILNRAPVPPRELNGNLPEKLEEIISKCLEKDREERYQGAKEIAIDLRRMIAPASVTRTTAITPRKERRSGVAGAATAVAVVAVIIAGWMLVRGRSRAPAVVAWEQMTDFPDSATMPALSPDGRVLAFVRGPNTFLGPGDVYLKLLAGGEPQRLTNDDAEKRDPVFSPDGSRVVYTVGGPPYDTWSVPITGGQPQLLIRNAADLTWSGNGRVVFAEARQGGGAAIVSASESRSEVRDVYIPPKVSGMAHRAAVSPDGKWVLIAEMDTSILGWLPCRLVQFGQPSPGRPVGPLPGPCTSAAWSPDGNWMYFSSAAGGRYHIWRQRFPEGRAEQVTFGPTQEEGMAIAPDGRSLITSVGGSQSTLWVSDDHGERQVDTAAAVTDPHFSVDGSKLFFVIRKQLRDLDQLTGDLWALDLKTSSRERLLPGFLISEYDVSPDGKSIAVTVVDDQGQSNLWIASMDRHTPPRRIEWPGSITSGRFDRSGGLFLRASEGSHEFAFHIDLSGGKKRKVIPNPINDLIQVSPAGQWLLVRGPLPGGEVPRLGLLAYPVKGGDPIIVSGSVWLPARWSADGKFFQVTFSQDGMLAIAMIPVTAKQELPTLPPSGLNSAEDIAAISGAYVVQRPIRTNDLAAYAQSQKLSTYAVVRTVVHRNLYRVPLPN